MNGEHEDQQPDPQTPAPGSGKPQPAPTHTLTKSEYEAWVWSQVAGKMLLILSVVGLATLGTIAYGVYQLIETQTTQRLSNIENTVSTRLELMPAEIQGLVLQDLEKDIQRSVVDTLSDYTGLVDNAKKELEKQFTEARIRDVLKEALNKPQQRDEIVKAVTDELTDDILKFLSSHLLKVARGDSVGDRQPDANQRAQALQLLVIFPSDEEEKLAKVLEDILTNTTTLGSRLHKIALTSYPGFVDHIDAAHVDRILDQLATVTPETDVTLRQAYIDFFSRLHAAHVRHLKERLVTEIQPESREILITSLAEMAHDESLAQIIDLATDTDPSIRDLGWQALGRINPHRQISPAVRTGALLKLWKKVEDIDWSLPDDLSAHVARLYALTGANDERAYQAIENASTKFENQNLRDVYDFLEFDADKLSDLHDLFDTCDELLYFVVEEPSATCPRADSVTKKAFVNLLRANTDENDWQNLVLQVLKPSKLDSPTGRREQENLLLAWIERLRLEKNPPEFSALLADDLMDELLGAPAVLYRRALSEPLTFALERGSPDGLKRFLERFVGLFEPGEFARGIPEEQEFQAVDALGTALLRMDKLEPRALLDFLDTARQKARSDVQLARSLVRGLSYTAPGKRGRVSVGWEKAVVDSALSRLGDTDVALQKHGLLVLALIGHSLPQEAKSEVGSILDEEWRTLKPTLLDADALRQIETAGDSTDTIRAQAGDTLTLLGRRLGFLNEQGKKPSPRSFRTDAPNRWTLDLDFTGTKATWTKFDAKPAIEYSLSASSGPLSVVLVDTDGYGVIERFTLSENEEFDFPSLDRSGEHFMLLRRVSEDASTAVLSLTSRETPALIEAATSSSNATPIEVNKLYRGELEEGRSHWLKLTMKANTEYRIESSRLRGEMDTVVALFNDEEIFLQDNDDASSNTYGSRLAWTSIADGNYLVEVNNIGSKGKYDLIVKAQPAPEAQAFLLPATFEQPQEVQLDMRYRANLNANGEKWLQIAATEGASYFLRSSRLGNEIDTTISVHDANLESLASNDDANANTLASHLEWTSPSTDDYLINVANIADASGSFDFVVREVPALTVGREAALAPSSTGATQPLETNALYEVELNPDQQQWLRVGGKAPAWYTVETANLSGDVDTVLSLYRGDESYIDENDDAEDDTFASRLVWEGAAGESFLVQIENIGSAGAFDLIVRETPP